MADDLKIHYRKGLPARIEALEKASALLGTEREKALDSARKVAHSLRGSGATYGFPEISKAAGAVEDADDADVEGSLKHLLKILKDTVEERGASKKTILIVEDDPDISHLFEIKLAGPNREVVVAETTEEADALIQENDITLIVLDLVLPDMDGRKYLAKLRERSRSAEIPVFVVSGKVGDKPKQECLALGADDYFEKPFDPGTIANAVSAKLDGIRETAAIGKDPITGLPNRAAFIEALEKALSAVQDIGNPLSLAVVDTDRLEALKEKYGEKVCRKVLRTTGQFISNALGENDFLARMGSEDFAVLFPNSSQEHAVEHLQSALNTLRSKVFKLTDGTSFQVTFSAGVVQIVETQSPEEALAEADRVLYHAKVAGRNRVLSAKDIEAPAKKKILFAEDDDLIASIVKHRLEREGFEVLHRSDGAAAFSAAQEEPIALAIIDVKMPVMDGFELLERLRGDPSFERIPIVMLTAMGSERDIARGLNLGADDYIPKPFSPVELLARIRRLLKR
mgnify:CR=1 FL=1